MPDANNLRAAIEALQSQRDRGTLDEAAADAGLAVLREQLRKFEEDALPEPAAERKQATVMFADISGFTALSERTDAEEVRSLVNQCFDALGEVISRYGGHIDKFIGDEVMVLFGAPLAIEDHASRALHAALELHEKFAGFNETHVTLKANPLSLHTGVNSGLVVAGAIGTEAKREYTVMGDPVNVAARLVAQAEPGEILVGEQTRRLGGAEFDFEDLGDITLEGRARSQQVYRLRGKKLIAETQRASERPTMIGRQGELAVLQGAVHGVAQEKRARAVAVIGAAGIGKSRLRDELRGWLQGEGLSLSLLEGAALPRMASTPYFIVADLLRNLLGVTHADSSAAVRLRLEGLLSELGDEDVETAHALAAILAVDYEDSELMKCSAEERRSRIFRALTAVLRKVSQKTPAVLLLNDLHWADDQSVDILQHVFADLQDTALLIVMFTRPVVDPESRLRQVEARLASERYTRVVLEELDDPSSRELLLSLAPGLDRWPAAVDTIMQKAQGNPFYIEEIVRSLVDASALVTSDEGVQVAAGGLDNLSVPDTVWGVLAERIDGLPTREKGTIQNAAIVGRIFWEGAVRELIHTECADELRMLQDREMVAQVGPAPFVEDWEWRFHHALVQEVAYSSLLHETRKDGHLAAARWIERSAGDRLKEYSTLLAHHYQLGEDWTRVAHFAEMAGDRASDLFAHNEASAAYLQALHALQQLDKTRANSVRQIDVALRLARESAFSPTDEVLQALEAAKQLADEVEDTERQVRVLVAIASWRYASGQPKIAVELALPAVTAAKQAGLDELLVVPYLLLGRGMFMTGGYRNAVDLTEQAQDLAKRFGNDLDQWAGLGLGPNLAFLGAAYQQLGEIERGRALGLDSIQTAESHNDQRQIAISHLFYGGTHSSFGCFADCEEHLELALRLCEETKDLAGIQPALGWLGRALAWRGELQQASAHLDRTLQMGEELGFMPWRPLMQSYRSEIYVMAGEPHAAVDLATKAVELAVETRQRPGEGEAHRVLAWALHFAGGASHERIRGEFQSAVDVNRSTGAQVFVANALFDLSRYLAISGQTAESAEVEREASSIKDELGLDWLPMPALGPRPARV